MFVDADKFLNELHKLYERNKTSGTVYVTTKRSNLKPTPKRKSTEPVPQPVMLIRATDGKRKISAAISAKEHVRFQTACITLQKAHMDSLKKREREKKKKGKASAENK